MFQCKSKAAVLHLVWIQEQRNMLLIDRVQGQALSHRLPFCFSYSFAQFLLLPSQTVLHVKNWFEFLLMSFRKHCGDASFLKMARMGMYVDFRFLFSKLFCQSFDISLFKIRLVLSDWEIHTICRNMHPFALWLFVHCFFGSSCHTLALLPTLPNNNKKKKIKKMTKRILSLTQLLCAKWMLFSSLFLLYCNMYNFISV